MASTPIIPIRCERPEAAGTGLLTTRVQGDPQRLAPLQAALEQAVHGALEGIAPASRWLRELHLSDDEAHVLIAPGLGCDGMDAAEIAFETLRRLLPDTDIYVSAAPA